jgi:hypothetical protein
MQFTLYYRGKLKSNARPEEKHDLRRHFHRQLRVLWDEPPLNDFKNLLRYERRNENGVPEELGILQKAHGFEFAPLVCENVALVAELEIKMLWPQAPGAIVSAGGDIDNRLKTLFDSLKMPCEATALPKGAMPGPDEQPFFCLLEDDRLITRVSVETDRLLEPPIDPSDVALFIRVRTRLMRTMMGTIGLA